MNTPVNFKLAKLLKEEGFDKPVHQYYQFIRDLSSTQDKTWQFINSFFLVRESDAAMFPDEGKNGVVVAAYSDRIYRDYNLKTSEDFISAPTIAETIMWLYEKYGIWIWVERCSTLFRPYAEEIGNERFGKWGGHKYNSLTEAYLKAIEYTLKTLV